MLTLPVVLAQVPGARIELRPAPSAADKALYADLLLQGTLDKATAERVGPLATIKFMDALAAKMMQ